MQYALLLWPHANIRYMDALQKLAKGELSCLLKALGIEAPVESHNLGGAPFLTFEAPEMNESAFRALSGLSSFYLIAQMEKDCLKPLCPTYPWYLPADAAEVLKYKGKTNASFTSLMINCALSASDFFPASTPLTVLDPMSGKGTSLYCALRMGHHATGIEIDKKDWKEAGDYFSRYLQMHKYKHQKKTASLTLPKGQNAPELRFTFADTPEHYNSGEEKLLRMIQGDARRASEMLKPASAHLIVCDLPYGVQHAPQQGQKPLSLTALLNQTLPGLKKVLKPGGAAAFSFNTYTLSRQTLLKLLADAGFMPLTQAPYDDFEHWVEQAVNRDLVIAR